MELASPDGASAFPCGEEERLIWISTLHEVDRGSVS
jgi:hypothetical protein